MLAAILGIALTIMPLYILSFEPGSPLQRLQTPLCTTHYAVELTNQDGGDFLKRPDTGLKIRALIDGQPHAAKFTIFVKMPGEDWKYRWELGAPQGHEIYFLPDVKAGEGAYVRATDPNGKICPSDSPSLFTKD